MGTMLDQPLIKQSVNSIKLIDKKKYSLPSPQLCSPSKVNDLGEKFVVLIKGKDLRVKNSRQTREERFSKITNMFQTGG